MRSVDACVLVVNFESTTSHCCMILGIFLPPHRRGNGYFSNDGDILEDDMLVALYYLVLVFYPFFAQGERRV